MHTALLSGWAGTMSLYELITIDPTDPVYNPIWRQGCFVLPFISRLGVISSLFSWSLGIDQVMSSLWSYETVNTSHLLLSGLCILASIWHWVYWDLDVFISLVNGKQLLDLNKVLGIHLLLSAIVCYLFGICHLAGYSGPGIWTSDSFGIAGSIRLIKPMYSLVSLASYCYGVISSNHIIAGFFGLIISLWHVSTRPGVTQEYLYSSSLHEEKLASLLV